jgi:hypothetical protein
MVRPGGVLAVTTWGPRPFDPGATALWEAVAEVRPDLVRAFSPWDALVTPGALRDVLRRGGIERSEADAEDGEQAMRGADDWWTVVLGTGYRATIDALSPDHRARVERHVRAAMDGGPPVRTPLVLGTARKPS